MVFEASRRHPKDRARDAVVPHGLAIRYRYGAHTDLPPSPRENVRGAIRPEVGQGPVRHPTDRITNTMAQIPRSRSRARLVSGAIAVRRKTNLAAGAISCVRPSPSVALIRKSEHQA